MKRFALLLFFLLLLAGVGTGYFWLVNTPEYALVDLAQAIEGQSFDQVDKRVNVEAVADHLAEISIKSQLAALNKHNGSQPGNWFGLLTQGISSGIVQMMRPALATQATKQLKMAINDSNNAKYVKDLGMKAVYLVLTHQTDHVKLTSRTQKNDTAVFDLQIEDTPTTLLFKRNGFNGWELTQIDVPQAKLVEWLSLEQKIPPAS